ncbi:MAG: Protease 3 precursor [candidate division TA06 bacterium ADurb.Bin131]|uniref:Protease 3 n=1 Tax=candidate division TA06 bacterium ADurb.Bin131 TaxID=1852827 RepID=A0A1V6C659_UNCT6|nr:MAG: Protease 3 precursor [candidate division TA06 bacterium ADurb.Bin131]HRV03997.1 pitrilysin family protein [Candidatus Ratteibacteria bacterium]
MDWEIANLKNSMQVIHKQKSEYYSVSIGILVRSGSRYETPNYAGISHFVEHLVFKGTKSRSARELKESIEGKGGSFNAFTSEEVICFYVKILEPHLETGIDILSDMIKNPLFNPEEINKERNVIIEEINMYRDFPARYVFELLNNAMFGDHPLGTSILGTPESLRNINRETLFNFVENYHTGKNLVLSVAGRFNEDKLIKIADKFLSNIKEGTDTSFVRFEEKMKTPSYKIKIKETEQCHFCLGFHAYPRNDDRRFALSVANMILGGNMSSRLFNEIRENRGLAYDIRSYARSYYDTGAAIISAGLIPANLIESLKIIKEQIRIMIEQQVKEDEIERAKEYLVSQFLMGLEDPMEYMLWIGEQLAAKEKMLSINQVQSKIRAVTEKDIQDVCRDIFKKNPCFAMIGPENKLDDVSKILEDK